MQTVSQPKPALPLLLLLVFASALGVAVAIALAGVAMLLAAPAYADDGRLLLERRGGYAEATLLFTERYAEHDGVLIVEAYHNPFDEPLAGVYLHRLPSDAVLERLTFTAGAIEALPAVLRRRYTGALVEPTADIGPGETLLVELEYRTLGAARLLKLLEL